jgi:hypothetical protein
MPIFHKGFGRGYDLDLELEFYELDGVRYQLGTAGSFIMACAVCGAEHFRDRIAPENCFEGHGALAPLRLDEREKYIAIWQAAGDRITTTEERREKRIAREALAPWNWAFGEKTEADFPLGYAKDDIADPAQSRTSDF